MRVLIVEDNERFRALVSEHLTAAGFVVDQAHTIEDFSTCAATSQHDIYLIDLTLPDGTGLDLIRNLRKGKTETPILVLTAECDIDSRVAGLEVGADDYLTKPFNYRELVARIRALLRRPPNLPASTVEVGHVELDRLSGEVFCNGKRLELRPSEQRLLALLIKRVGRIVPRNTIENALQELGSERSSNAIDKLVSRLRSALHDESTGLQLKTVRGSGYTLEIERTTIGNSSRE